MTEAVRTWRTGRVVEALLTTVIVAAAVRVVIFAISRGYLPQPFFFAPSDTFADWFNPAHWARVSGAYGTYSSLYPPLSFVLLRVFGLDYCYDHSAVDFSAGLAARSCDWLGVVSIFGFYLLDVVLVFICFWKRDRSRALLRTTAVGLGYPLLNGLERGNLILVAFACVILAFGPILKSSRARACAAACAVNFKIYLVAAVAPLIIKRRWHWVELSLILTVAVYLVTFAILGQGTLLELLNNIAGFNDQTPQSPLDIWMSGSYKPAVGLLRSGTFPAVLVLGSSLRDFLLVVLPAAMIIGQTAILAALAASALRPEVVTPFRLVNLGILLAEISSEAGAYTIVLHTFFVFMEPWRGFGRKFAIVMCYLVAIPFEIPVQDVAPGVGYSYIANTTVTIQYYVGASPFIRPMTTIAIAVALSLVTLREVWLDIRHQGWSGRWRLRGDAPLLPWIRRPIPPTE